MNEHPDAPTMPTAPTAPMPTEMPTSQDVAPIVERLTVNHANTGALIACLLLCARAPQPTPYRAIEDQLASDPSMGVTLQTPHTILSILIQSGAVERIEQEPGNPEGSSQQPVDYLVRITDAGRAALEQLDPVARFAEVVSQEPNDYLEVYARVLDTCAKPEGAARAEIEAALESHPALSTPKRVYPSYFISKLETVGGLSWDGTWHATEAGEQMLAAFSA